jgi:mRNA interferase RelE/StbE
LKYDVRLARRADRELASLEQSTRSRIIERLRELRDDPFPRGAVKLQGRESVYRIRVGDYRVLYEVFRKEAIVLVDKVDHRSGVYGP